MNDLITNIAFLIVGLGMFLCPIYWILRFVYIRYQKYKFKKQWRENIKNNPL